MDPSSSRKSSAPAVSALPVAAAAVIAALPFPAIVIDLEDYVAAANAEGDALFEAGGSALAGARPRFKDLRASYRVPRLRAGLEAVKAGGPPAILTDINFGGAEPNDAYLVFLRPLTETSGRLAAVLVIALDTTQLADAKASLAALRLEHEDLTIVRHGMESAEFGSVSEELRVTNEALQEQIGKVERAEIADARKNRFLAMLAHELRNPLGAISNALLVIRRLTVNDRQVVHALRIAERQIRHEARLLDDLLDTSRIALGKVTLKREAVDLRQCVRHVVDGMSFAVKGGLLELSSELPDKPVPVLGDAVRLEQCVSNLLSNAIKFTPPGGRITLTLRPDGDEAILTVIDTGIGIEAAMLGKVFDLFTQADAMLARTKGGLGIGLTLVRTLVELHEGHVRAHSEGSGRGSEFEVRLPLTTEVPAEPPAREPSAAHPQRVLVVEDNADAREMLKVLLEMDGHTVVEARTGAAAIRLAAEEAPDVVLLDIGLPGLDGFEVARRIRRRLGHQIRLVALSGYADSDTIEQGRVAGFDAHLVKPVSPGDLARALTGAEAAG